MHVDLPRGIAFRSTYAKTFENSEDGDMTKLSFVLAHDIRCCMLGSSNMLRSSQRASRNIALNLSSPTCIAYV